ncbi:MAG: carboxylesterase family protein, partial [Alphaproteobacteria bacterium]|nr:carboxylesterase family protein [Alphaproteobacteria bacterium]
MPSEPIVEIANGKLRGAQTEGVYAFKGIPYGASTGGANRFQPPHPAEPWAGVRDALALGGRAPQWQGAPIRRPGMASLLGP